LSPHPHTGLSMPIRANYEVSAPSASTQFDVPTTDLAWDAATQGFTTVTPGTRARSIVNYTYTLGKWHDGSDFTTNDILYEIALAYRRANAAGDVYAKDADAAAADALRFTNLLRGLEVSGNRVTMYFDYWHPDPGMVAAIGNPAFPVTPWTGSELALSTIFDDTCRVSEVTAGNEGREA